MKNFGVLLLLLVLHQFALAGVAGKGGPTITPNAAGNIWEVVYDAGNTVSTTRNWSKAEAGAVKVTDAISHTIGGKYKVPLSIASRVSASAVARVATKALPLVGPASLAYDIWSELRCKYEDGSISCDPGAEPDNAGGGGVAGKYNTQCNPNSYSSSATAACNAAIASCAGPTNVRLLEVRDGRCFVADDNTPTGFLWLNVGFVPGNDTGGALTCPNGGPPSTWDLKCPSGNYVPKTEDGASDHFGENAPKIPGIADKLPGIVKEASDAGVPVPVDDPVVSGPSSVPGPSTSSTTTNSNGVTQVTTTTTNYNLTYNNNKFVVSEQVVTTNPDGSTVTEETQPKEDVSCALDPSSIACAKLGTADGNPEWSTKEVLYTPENLGFGGTCPAPWTATIHGWSLSMSYQPACDVAPQIRAGVLALAALSALLLIINAVKS